MKTNQLVSATSSRNRAYRLHPTHLPPPNSSRLAWATLAKCCFSSRASSQTFNCCCKWSICLPRFVFFRIFFVATQKKKITIENHNTTSNHLSYPCWIWLMWLMMIMKTITRGVGRKWVKKKPTGKSRTSTVSSVENLRPLRPEGSYLPFKKGRFLTLDPRGFRYHKWPLNGTATYQVDRCWGQIIFLPSLWN